MPLVISSNARPQPAASAGDAPSPGRCSVTPRLFWILLVTLLAAAIVRSAFATRLDSFTQDEGYHILAGVSYVRRGDFRINSEHPPLVKLWVGSIVSATGFHLSPFREMHDKGDERDFAEEEIYVHNDPDSVQRRARIAMWILNGFLLAILTLALAGGPGLRRLKYRSNRGFRRHFRNWGCPRSRGVRDLGLRTVGIMNFTPRAP